MTRIVVLSGSVSAPSAPTTTDDSSLVSAALAAAPDAVVEIVRFSPGPRGIMVGPATAPLDRMLRALGGYAIRDRLSRFPLGRLINSLGPLDQGRVFWRSLRRDPAALSALRSADAVYAVDLAAVKAAWIAVHREWVPVGHYDHAGAAQLTADPR